MRYLYYEIISKDDFDALNVPSKAVDILITELGLQTVLVTKGNYYSFLYDDVFVTYNLNNRNPFLFEDYAIYLKDGMFYLGVKQ